MNIFKKRVVDLLKGRLNEYGGADITGVDVEPLIEVPPDPKMGDYALPCFALAKALRRSPNIIARDLATGLVDEEGLIYKVENAGGYVNLFVDNQRFTETVLTSILSKGDSYGSSTEGEGKTVLLDFSSPNIAKPFTVGHLRSTVIGNSLYKIYSFLGYPCVRINHIGDWGTQFGKVIAAYKRWGSPDDFTDNTSENLMVIFQLYVRFHKEAETDPSLEEEGRMWFRKLEDGDEEAKGLWKLFTEINLKEFKRIYDLMGVEFDSYAGESFYEDKAGPMVEQIRQAGLVQESEGALIVDLSEYDMPPCLLQKKDGATLYATRDLAAAVYRFQEYGFHKLIYVVGMEQTLYFNQIFKVLELLGYPWADSCVHVPFGLIRFAQGRMSTRHGKVIFLEEVLTQAIESTRSIIEDKNPLLEDKERIATEVGVGAVIFGDLRNNRIKDVKFDWDEILNFDGETGPYVQYTHARASSISRKGGPLQGSIDFSLLVEEEELAVVKLLAQFPNEVKAAADEYEPSVVARYLIEVARAFNKFYNAHRVLVEDEAQKEARVALVEATRQVLANGLGLLGMAAPPEM
jgi:arginyl-tRNA synthetase